MRMTLSAPPKSTICCRSEPCSRNFVTLQSFKSRSGQISKPPTDPWRSVSKDAFQKRDMGVDQAVLPINIKKKTPRFKLSISKSAADFYQKAVSTVTDWNLRYRALIGR